MSVNPSMAVKPYCRQSKLLGSSINIVTSLSFHKLLLTSVLSRILKYDENHNVGCVIHNGRGSTGWHSWLVVVG